MNTTQKRRLLKLANFLENDPRVKKKFNLVGWFGWKDTARNLLIDSGVQVEKMGAKKYLNTCGTTACAVGWAPICMPSLFKQYRGLVVFKPANSRGFAAAIDAFGITNDEADKVFHPLHYKVSQRQSIKAVVKRMRALAKQYDTKPVS